MGTASHSIRNQIQRDEFDKLLKDAIGGSLDREIQLGNVFRRVVNEVLNNDPALAGVRPTLQNAVDNKVKVEITNKLKSWIANGKKPEDWPFKNDPTL
jgi:hypothetical protein